MVRSSCFKGISTARRLASALALPAALAGAALLAIPAAAQDYSKNFVEAYQPVAEALNAEGADVAAIRAQFPTVIAAAETPDDQHAIGNLILQAGVKARDQQLQRQGLEMMVASEKAAPEKLGEYNYYIGSLAFNAKDYAAARPALERALAAGYTSSDNDIRSLILESYFAENNTAAALDYIKREGASGQVPENWLLKGLQRTYDQQMTAEAMELSGMLVEQYPTERNWTAALQVVNALHEFDPKQRLDLLRLMRAAGVMSERSDFVRYIEAADPRIMSNEVIDVMAEAAAAGALNPSETYYVEVKSITDVRAPIDRREAAGLVSEARSASDPMRAVEAGDVAYSLGNYAEAEEMYQLALDKGTAEKDTVLTRLGIAQAMQGKNDLARTNFEQVNGPREPIATMWSRYVASKAG